MLITDCCHIEQEYYKFLVEGCFFEELGTVMEGVLEAECYIEALS
jgi:hypothetical protein